MKELTVFQCPVCSKIYAHKESAARCEQRGVFNPSVFQKGLILRMLAHPNHYAYILSSPIANTGNPHKGRIELYYWPKDGQFRDGHVEKTTNLDARHGFEDDSELQEIAEYIRQNHRVIASFYNTTTNQVQIINHVRN